MLELEKTALEGDHPDFLNYSALSYGAETNSKTVEHLEGSMA